MPEHDYGLDAALYRLRLQCQLELEQVLARRPRKSVEHHDGDARPRFLADLLRQALRRLCD